MQRVIEYRLSCPLDDLISDPVELGDLLGRLSSDVEIPDLKNKAIGGRLSKRTVRPPVSALRKVGSALREPTGVGHRATGEQRCVLRSLRSLCAVHRKFAGGC